MSTSQSYGLQGSSSSKNDASRVDRSPVLGAERPGLDSSQTSSPEHSLGIPLDQKARRLKRLRSAVLTSARLCGHQQPGFHCFMITLTYASDYSWRPRHVSAMLKAVRAWASRNGVDRLMYQWVMEGTKAGREHYHLLLWLPRSLYLPRPDRCGWWPHGSTNVLRARSAVGYLAKYASKASEVRKLPKGSRLYGQGGLVGEFRNEWRWWRLPGWLRVRTPSKTDSQPRRVARVGWVTPEGEVLQSPWLVVFQAGSIFLRLRGHADSN